MDDGHAEGDEERRLADARSAIGDGFLWDGLAYDAEYHGVAPVLFQLIRGLENRHAGLVPREVGHSFKALARRHHLAALAREDCIDRLILAFDAAKVDLVLLKGAALAHQIYADPGLRPMVDIDVLVAPGDLARAASISETLGFVFPGGHPSAFAGRHHHLPAGRLHHAGVDISLEIHRDAVSANHARRLTMADLFCPPQRLARGERPAGLRLGHVDMLRHLTLHAFEPSRHIRLVHLCDLWRYHARYRNDIEWASVERRFPNVANALRMTSYVFSGAYDVSPLPPVPSGRPRDIGKGMMTLHEILGLQLGGMEKVKALFRPSPWWLHGFYGVRPEGSLRACRFFRHPATLSRWFGKRLFLSRGLIESMGDLLGQAGGFSPTDRRGNGNTQMTEPAGQIMDRIPIRAEDVAMEEIDDEILLFHQVLMKTSHLNPSAATIWKLCDGVRHTRDIVSLITDAYPDCADSIASEVVDTLARLRESGLVAFK